jgi:uncharacterized protein (TIGR00730 family)
MTTQRRIVTVFGSAQAEPGSPAYEEAHEAGRLLAQAGLAVCSGGYAGVMEGVSRGAKEAGGTAIGVTASLFVNRAPNRWLDQEICRATYLERMQTMVEMGQAYLALQGGIGTLCEIGVVWSLLQTRSIPPRPFFLLRNPWQGLLEFSAEALILHQEDLLALQLASTPAEAVLAIVTQLKTRTGEG